MSNLETAADLDDENGLGGETDIKDIEFRMRHDQRKVRNLLEGARAYTLRDLTLLKIILTSGLYPQLAVADEFNGGKASGADQLFHTKVKPFNVLHPNCIFAASPGKNERLFLGICSMLWCVFDDAIQNSHEDLLQQST